MDTLPPLWFWAFLGLLAALTMLASYKTSQIEEKAREAQSTSKAPSFKNRRATRRRMKKALTV